MYLDLDFDIPDRRFTYTRGPSSSWPETEWKNIFFHPEVLCSKGFQHFSIIFPDPSGGTGCEKRAFLHVPDCRRRPPS